MKRQTSLFISTAATLLLAACSPREPEYRIGVSQCSEDIWRDWQNAEMRIEANFRENVALSFATAHDDSQLQIRQIDSLVSTGIDLLIVAPNQLSNVSPAIDRAYDSGIPVIVFERKTDSQKYTVFVSADNYGMGHQMGQYIAHTLGGRGRLMEVEGLRGSSSAAERHKGFRDAISRFPGIQVVATLQGDWTEQTAYDVVRAYAQTHETADIDVIFGHNDRTAMGARRAYLERMSDAQGPSPLFYGIDGLPGEAGGIRQVRDSLLAASYIYPTRGDLLVKVALDILEGRPHAEEYLLTSAMVTRENAAVLYLESEEVLRRAQQLELLQAKANGYLQRLAMQHTVFLLALSVLGLSVLAAFLFYLYRRNRRGLYRERALQNLWHIEAPPTPDTPLPTPDTPDPPLPTPDSPPLAADRIFVARFKEVVGRRMADSNLSVEDIAADMHLSRVQLYRKVKALTGNSPVELLRTTRLNQGYQLLLTTDKTVSEVAYAVGFSAPGYFTKCFKEEFGKNPSELRTQQA